MDEVFWFKNVVVVIVMVILLFFVWLGLQINVNVVVIGDVKSLFGGILVMMLLNVVDGEIYVVVQGFVIVGGVEVSGVVVLVV